MFSSRSFIVSALTFKSLIRFEFISVYGVRKCSSFILLQVVDQFSHHHLLKRLSFLHCIFLPPLSKIRCPQVHGFISGLSILFHWSIVLSLFCAYILLASQKDSSHTGSGPVLMTSFNLNYLFKDLISKYSYILGYQRLGHQHNEFWGD